MILIKICKKLSIYSALLSDHTRHPLKGGDLINLINYLFVVKDSRLRGNDGEFKDFTFKLQAGKNG